MPSLWLGELAWYSFVNGEMGEYFRALDWFARIGVGSGEGERESE